MPDSSRHFAAQANRSRRNAYLLGPSQGPHLWRPVSPITEKKGANPTMISVEEALERILAQITPLPIVQIPLPDAPGLILAHDIIAQEAIPPFANSAMDGFALLSKD